MSKQYLIPESSLIGKIKTTSTIVSDEMIEVEVLDEEQSCRIYHDYYTKSTLPHFSDYLAANNLQIIKTVK